MAYEIDVIVHDVRLDGDGSRVILVPAPASVDATLTGPVVLQLPGEAMSLCKPGAVLRLTLGE